ncbi:WecB/TagA/CpsF family glycosyltransferase [Neomesorhizobium albiziae]|nr:WecB/TagA/CpsF family glycosyltransferase [Mesorhizobium albiziae]GLS34340.1 UDP-N-acetyl-D-mannosaminuronic acid transferase [Mesorhizobium albiziae]
MNMQSSRPPFDPPELREILGVAVASVTAEQASRLFLRLIAERRFTKVSFLNAHNANVAANDPAFERVLSDFLILPDGVGVDVAARVLYGEPFPANLNGTDFIPGFLRAAAIPLKVGLLGATRKNADQAAARLLEIAPQHRIEVIHDGFFTESQEPEILDRLVKFRPDILLVAMGVPRQEFWIAGNLDREHCTLPVAVGALFDFLSGAVPRAPGVMRRLRMEWLFRMIIEPGRLWRRYIVGNPLFLLRVFRQKLLPGDGG